MIRLLPEEVWRIHWGDRQIRKEIELEEYGPNRLTKSKSTSGPVEWERYYDSDESYLDQRPKIK
jgi:hypothetical protein